MRSCTMPSSSARCALASADSTTALRITSCAVERLGSRGVLVHQPREQIRIQAPPVHADAHRLVVTAGDLDHFRELRIALGSPPDVARVDAVLGERRRALRVLTQQLVTVEMKIADQRHVDAGTLEPLADRRDRGGRLAGVHGDAHQLRARARQRFHLARRAGDVRGVGIGHRLHDDGRAAADADATDRDLH